MMHIIILAFILLLIGIITPIILGTLIAILIVLGPKRSWKFLINEPPVLGGYYRLTGLTEPSVLVIEVKNGKVKYKFYFHGVGLSLAVREDTYRGFHQIFVLCPNPNPRVEPKSNRVYSYKRFQGPEGDEWKINA
jgi:hypothetical protein